jgi:hypothetical protein
MGEKQSQLQTSCVTWNRRTPNFKYPRETVTFIVGTGDSQEEFIVHEEFMCHYSPVLKAGFNSSFVEGSSGEYKLDDVDPAVFRLLIEWIYTQDIEMCCGLASLNHPKGWQSKNYEDPLVQQFFDKQNDNLVQLWNLADRLLMPSLQNAVISTLAYLLMGSPEPIIQRLFPTPVDQWTSTSWFPRVWAETTEGSPLRRLTLDIGLRMSQKDFEENSDHFPPDMLMELVSYMKEIIKDPPCNYRLKDYLVADD